MTQTPATEPGCIDRFGLLAFARRVRSFRAEKRGVAAIEFGLIAPFMIALWLGSIELSQTVSIDRKVSHSASALADLITQQTNLTAGEMSDIMDATQAILAPHDANNLSIEIAGVRIDGNGATEVLWSEARNGAAPATGGTYAIPSALLIPNSFLVAANLSYTHTPAVAQAITGSIELSDAFYLRPRRSDTISYNP
ncbi:MAG: pilus assembly protein [Hyphomicrobiales bacterium]|jgi:Flp pilus assembly protein TadG